MNWSDRAACLGADPDLFFPVGSGGVAVHDTAAAKAICSACPVIGDCRSYAFHTRQTFGVWGGLDEEERRLALAGEPLPASA